MQKGKRTEYTASVEVSKSTGIIYVSRVIEGIEPPFTKWDFLSDDERISYENTQFTANGTGECSQCGTPLPTEADFAKHFIVDDPRWFNLGYCPNVKKEN